MGLDFRDFNNDGYPDIVFVALNNQTFPLYPEHGQRRFSRGHDGPSGMRDASMQMSGFGAGLYDFDNDGWKDLFVTRGHVESIPLPSQPVDQYNTVFHNPGASGKWVSADRRSRTRRGPARPPPGLRFWRL